MAAIVRETKIHYSTVSKIIKGERYKLLCQDVTLLSFLAPVFYL